MSDSNAASEVTYSSIEDDLNTIFWLLDKYVYELVEPEPNDGKRPWERDDRKENNEFKMPCLTVEVCNNKELMSDPESLACLRNIAVDVSWLAERLHIALNAAAYEAGLER